MNTPTLVIAAVSLFPLALMRMGISDQVDVGADVENNVQNQQGSVSRKHLGARPITSSGPAGSIRHVGVLVRADERAMEYLEGFAGGQSQELSGAEREHALGILVPSLQASALELRQAQDQYAEDQGPKSLLRVLRTTLEYTRADVRLDTFLRGQFVVVPVDTSRAPVAFTYPQVLAFHLQPVGERSVVVLISNAPTSPQGMASKAYSEALSHNAQQQLTAR